MGILLFVEIHSKRLVRFRLSSEKVGSKMSLYWYGDSVIRVVRSGEATPVVGRITSSMEKSTIPLIKTRFTHLFLTKDKSHISVPFYSVSAGLFKALEPI